MDQEWPYKLIGFFLALVAVAVIVEAFAPGTVFDFFYHLFY